jgi:hypothetical protein
MSSTQFADLASSIATTEALATALMDEIRDSAKYLTENHRYSLTVLASITGLHKNSVMRLADRSWLPKPETLERLERLIKRAEAKRSGQIFPGETIKRGRPVEAAQSKRGAKRSTPAAKRRRKAK